MIEVTKELKKLKDKFGQELTIVRPNGIEMSLNELCNSTKIDKKISTKIIRVGN